MSYLYKFKLITISVVKEGYVVKSSFSHYICDVNKVLTSWLYVVDSKIEIFNSKFEIKEVTFLTRIDNH